MTSSKTIAMRVYKIYVTRKGSTEAIGGEDSGLNDFLLGFAETNRTLNFSEDRERSWYFSGLEWNSEKSRAHALINYGMAGFESRLVDGQTQAENYRRKVTDTEEIDLFFEVICPASQDFALTTFQSFQGRSCNMAVLKRAKSLFEARNTGLLFKWEKLSPNAETSQIFRNRPIKGFRFKKKKAANDLADLYASDSNSADEINIELHVKAPRGRVLGLFGDLIGERSFGDGVFMYSDIEFTEATALIEVGGKLRPVGVVGTNQDFGVIDVTNDIEWGGNGHPTLESLRKCSQEILEDFYRTLAS